MTAREEAQYQAQQMWELIVEFTVDEDERQALLQQWFEIVLIPEVR